MKYKDYMESLTKVSVKTGASVAGTIVRLIAEAPFNEDYSLERISFDDYVKALYKLLEEIADYYGVEECLPF